MYCKSIYCIQLASSFYQAGRKRIDLSPDRWGDRGCGRLMCAPVVVVDAFGAGLEVGDGAGDFEDAVVGSSGHVYTLYDSVNKLNILQMPECL